MREENDTPLTEEELALARRGEELIAGAVADTEAPQSLRESIERDRARSTAGPPAPFWRRHARALGALAGVAAVLALTVSALPIESDESAPTLAGVEAAAQLEATGAAPASLGGSPPVIAAKVGALEFPDWEKSFDWEATGRRDDELSGRDVTTVFYRNPDGVQLGYAVVAGDALEDDPPGRPLTRDGRTYHVAEGSERTVVTWTQQGHTCLLVAPATVPESSLVDLAASRNGSPQS
jgi:hypothetical protein